MTIFQEDIFIANDTLIKPISLTKYYSLYFYDDPNEYIEFELTSERMELIELFKNNSFEYKNIFKFTGPNGIGKSFFLLYYSRSLYNIVYINITALRNLKEKNLYNKMKNIIIEEFKRVQLESKVIESFNKLIKNLSPSNLETFFISIIFFLREL